VDWLWSYYRVQVPWRDRPADEIIYLAMPWVYRADVYTLCGPSREPAKCFQLHKTLLRSVHPEISWDLECPVPPFPQSTPMNMFLRSKS